MSFVSATREWIMGQSIVAETVDRMVGLLDPALDAIEQGGGELNLRDLQALLQKLLIDLMRVVERNPGLEAAAADLYGAASAIVRDNGVHAVPQVRKLRLLREARGRFHERIATARPSELGTKILWRHHELLCA
jgi:hypothetical protein